jgi:hypothetical protein
LRRFAVQIEGTHSFSRSSGDDCCGGGGMGNDDLVGLDPCLDFFCFPCIGLIAVVGYAPT